MTLDWLIIGGGLHGVHLALALLGGASVDRERLRILDPNPRPFARWSRCSTAVGMQFMRSPSVHHLDGPPFSLAMFARQAGYSDKRDFRAPYNRPSTRLFNAHCEALSEAQQLHHLWIRGRAIDLFDHGDEIEVLTEDRSLRAKQVVLALGTDRPARPAWATGLAGEGVHVPHVFDDDFADVPVDPEAALIVVGGGISALQYALARCRASGPPPTVVSRQPLREAQFDSDPGWLGPLHLEGFARERDLGRRRAMIRQARNRGTAPQEVLRELRRAQHRGRVIVREATVTDARVDRRGAVELWSGQGPIARADRVVLATGFASDRPGPWLDPVIERLGLPCAACGYPIVDRALRWHPRIHVSGALAELELGPAARNISGARMASARLLEHLTGAGPRPTAAIVRLGSI